MNIDPLKSITAGTVVSRNEPARLALVRDSRKPPIYPQLMVRPVPADLDLPGAARLESAA